MKRLVILVTIAGLLAAPVAAQSLTDLLPALTLPALVATSSTKDCMPTPAMICPPQT